MKRFISLICMVLFFIEAGVFPLKAISQSGHLSDIKQDISIEWSDGKTAGTIEVKSGAFSEMRITRGCGRVEGNQFKVTSNGAARILITIDGVKDKIGSRATIISVQTANAPFAFLMRDVSVDYPIYMPDYSVVVLGPSDNRSFSDVKSDIE